MLEDMGLEGTVDIVILIRLSACPLPWTWITSSHSECEGQRLCACPVV